MSNFITCLYRTVLEVNCLFHAESAQNYLFKKTPAPRLNGGPLMTRNSGLKNRPKAKKSFTLLQSNVSNKKDMHQLRGPAAAGFTNATNCSCIP